MGLFGTSKKEWRNIYSKFENGNYDKVDYEILVEKLEKEDYINDDDAYYAIRAFLITISNVEVVDKVFADAERKDKYAYGYDPGKLQRFVSAWTVEEMLDKNNVFRAVINNKTFTKKGSTLMFLENKIYEFYVRGAYGLESARDEESVIFHGDLFDKDEEDIKKIIDYDLMLKDKYPDQRKEVLKYTESNGYVGVKSVEEIEAKMKEIGIAF